MPVQILVPLKPHDRVEELLPYFELLAPNGSSVIFLIPADASLFPWWLEALSLPANNGDRGTAIGTLSAHASLQGQLQLARARVAGLGRALKAKGLVVQIECYGGRLQSALNRLGESDSQTIVLRRKSSTVFDSWLRSCSFLRRRIARNEAAAMMLSLPRQSV
jgi:hypothetical protein